MAIEVKLWRFSLPYEAESLYLYSLRSGEEYLRQQFSNQDHGSLDWNTFYRLYSLGKIERITSLDQVPEHDYEWTPYHSWELDNNAFVMNVVDFFDPPDEYK